MPYQPRQHRARLATAGLVAFALSLSLPLPARAEGYRFLRQWGASGTANGEFYHPRALAFDAAGNLYVSDQDNNRVQKFTREGAFLAKWGAEGTGPGQFDGPCGIAVSPAGLVYVGDEYNSRIQVFTGEGVFVRQFGSKGTGPGQFAYEDDMGGGLSDLAIDRDGNVYATDTMTHRVQKFTAEGRFLLQWGSEGHGKGQFRLPRGIAVDAQGQVYVVDTFNYRVQKFTSSGACVSQWGTRGYGRGQFMGPWGLALDTTGNLYVTDANAYDFITGGAEDMVSRLLKFSGAGACLAQWGEHGEGPGQLSIPEGVAVDPEGKVYVADSGNDRIVVFARD